MKYGRIPAPSPAMAVALLALIVALSGTAFAGPIAQLSRLINGDRVIKKHSLSGNRLRDHTLTGQQINLSKLGTVPKANIANTAGFAATAGSANTAITAAGASPTGPAGGDLTGGYPRPTLAPPEAWHEVGAPGEPRFQNSWQNNGQMGQQTAGFYKDSEGIVHLKGAVSGGSSNVIFQLPPGDRPANGTGLTVAAACFCQVTAVDPQGGLITVPVTSGNVGIDGSGISAGADGAVALGNNNPLAPGEPLFLDGISFRAES